VLITRIRLLTKATISFALRSCGQFACSYCWISHYTEYWCTARILCFNTSFL